MEWWKQQVAYQIYPRSFNDSNDDGVGDIPGIIEKLDYLKDLGITILWLSPVFQSPQKDYGYDISDYRDIDPMYGALDDMDLLIEEAKTRGIRIIMDLVMNHTSDQHVWFQKSRERIDPYTDYYIWKDAVNDGPPNNWTSIFTGSAWQYDNVRKQYYLHLFAMEQPDLNFHNPLVIKEIKEIMRFWLDKGVYGFRYDAINVIYKSSFEDGSTKNLFKGQEHYLAQQGNHDILHELYQDVLSDYDTFTVGELGEVTPGIARKFCDPEHHELDVLFAFEHLHTNSKYRWFKTKFKPKKFFEALVKWQNELPWNTVFFENHDLVRSVSQFGNDKRYWKESSKALATLLCTLRGTPFIYQGQEIGMTNFDYRGIEDTRDVESKRLEELLKRYFVPGFLRWKLIRKISRDNGRTPMQWTNGIHGGFSNETPWLQVSKNAQYINVETERSDPDSILNFYRDLIQFRQHSDVLTKGEFKSLHIDNQLFVYDRFDSSKRYRVAVNLSDKKAMYTIKGTLLKSNYDVSHFNGQLQPYQSVIIEIE
jgi:oligo-1,6-glucosidase